MAAKRTAVEALQLTQDSSAAAKESAS
jgi:hypothetical protein